MKYVSIINPGIVIPKTHNGPSHAAIDDETNQLTCWYGQDPHLLPVGPGVPIHCLLLEPLRLRVPFKEYPNRYQA